MRQRKVTIGPEVGLHARPAARFVKGAAACGCDVRVGRPGQQPVNAASMLSVLSLCARQGEELVLSADGENADAALAQLAAIVESVDEDPAAAAS